MWDLKTILESWFLPLSMAYEGGGRPTQPPSLRVPPWEADWGHPWGSSFNITSACIYLPQVRHSGVQRGAVVLLPPCPPGKYKIKRKLRLKSNTWQWQRLRICLNSLLIHGEKSFSLLKRILHYTRCTMTESRLNNLALIALHPKRLSELSTEKIIEMFLQASPRKL